MAAEVDRAPFDHAAHDGESHSQPRHGDGHGHDGGSEDPCCLTLSAVVKTVDSMAAAPELAVRLPALFHETVVGDGTAPAVRRLTVTLKPPGSLEPLELTCTLLI